MGENYGFRSTIKYTEIVIQQQSESLRILLLKVNLKLKNIFIITETDTVKKSFKRLFIQKSPELVTIILNDLAEFPY
jgi:hypothetical protein